MPAPTSRALDNCVSRLLSSGVQEILPDRTGHRGNRPADCPYSTRLPHNGSSISEEYAKNASTFSIPVLPLICLWIGGRAERWLKGRLPSFGRSLRTRRPEPFCRVLVVQAEEC